MKTILNHTLIGWTDFHENQLLRCKTHKEFEANIVLNMPQNTSFLDVGAHYGDTVLTMALFAKENKRNDIRFYAFEPNVDKCNHIRHIADLNRLNVTVYNNCVGYVRGLAKNDDKVDHKSGASSFQIDHQGTIKIMRLDDIKDVISPIGCVHIDTEGWDCHVLKGMREIFNDTINKGMYVVVEYWNDIVSKHQIMRGRSHGVISPTPESDIIHEMSKYDHIKFLRKLIDMDENLVFVFE